MRRGSSITGTGAARPRRRRRTTGYSGARTGASTNVSAKTAGTAPSRAERGGLPYGQQATAKPRQYRQPVTSPGERIGSTKKGVSFPSVLDTSRPSPVLPSSVEAVSGGSRRGAFSVPTLKEGTRLTPGPKESEPSQKEVLKQLRTVKQSRLQEGIHQQTRNIRARGVPIKLPKLPKLGTKGASGPLKRFKGRLSNASHKIERELDRQAELGNIEHPGSLEPGRGTYGQRVAQKVVGELIPDTPGEIAVLAAGAARAPTAAAGVAKGVKAARETKKGAKVVRELEKSGASLPQINQAKLARDFPRVQGGAPTAHGLEKGAQAATEVAGKATTAWRHGKKIKRARQATTLGAIGAGTATGDVPAITSGVAQSLTPKNIKQTAKTSLRGLASIPAAGAQLVGNLGLTGVRLAELTAGGGLGQKRTLENALDPTQHMAEGLWKEAKKEYEVFTSKDPERIKEATLHDYGILPEIGAVGIARLGAGDVARHAVQRVREARGAPALAEGADAPPIFKRWEDRPGARIKKVTGRVTTRKGWREKQLAAPIQKESDRLNTTSEGGKAESIRKMGTRSEQSKRAEAFNDKRGLKGRHRVDLMDLVAAAAENPMWHFKNKGEALDFVRRRKEYAPEGTAERVLIDFAEDQANAGLYDRPQFHKTVDVTNNTLQDMIRSEAVSYYPVFEEHAKNVEAANLDRAKRGLPPLEEPPMPERPHVATPLETRPYTDATTREGAKKEVLAERQALRAEKGQHPDYKLAEDQLKIAQSGVAAAKEKLKTAKRNNKGTNRQVQTEAQALYALEHARTRLEQAKVDRKAVLERAPKTERALELERRIEGKRATIGPVSLTPEERGYALEEQALSHERQGLPAPTARQQAAALRVAQREKRTHRTKSQQSRLEREFVQKGRSLLGDYNRDGKTPGYFPHARSQNLPPTRPGFARLGETPDKERLLGPGSIQHEGAVDYGYHRLLDSIGETARREAQSGFGAWIRDNFTHSADLGDGEQRIFTKDQLDKMFESGELDPAEWYAVRNAYFDNPEVVPRTSLDAISGVKKGDDRQLKLNEEAQLMGREGEGDGYYLVNQKDFDRYLGAQSDLDQASKWLSKIGTFQSRAILATSFAWMTSQIIAEGGLLVATQSPVRLVNGLRQIRAMRSNPETARIIAGISDAAYGTDPFSGARQVNNFQDGVAKAYDLSRRLPVNNFMKKMARFDYPGEWDRFKGGWLRDLYTLSEIDKQFNSRMRDMARSGGGTWNAIDNISHRMQGLTPEQQVRFLDTKEGMAATREFEINIDRALGNWTAMAPWERKLSQVVIFYPFMRFSVDWALRTFPADHPIRYTIATQMGQWNAEQLEDWLTDRPSFATDWLQAPIYGGEGQRPTSFTSFSRYAPGSNAFTEAIGSGKSLAGALLGMSNPFVSTIFRGLFKYNEFGEYDEKQTFLEAAGKAAVGLTAPARGVRQMGGFEALGLKGDVFEASDAPGSKGTVDLPGPLPNIPEYLLRSNVLPGYPQDYESQKARATQGELWGQVNDFNKQAQEPYPEEMDTPKFEKWRADDEARWKDVYKARGLSTEQAEEKAKVRSGKDIRRILKIGTKKSNPQRAEYRRYLEHYVSRTQGEANANKAKDRLIKLYNTSGTELSPSLETRYGDLQKQDESPSGPRFQTEYGSQQAAQILQPGRPFVADTMRNRREAEKGVLPYGQRPGKKTRAERGGLPYGQGAPAGEQIQAMRETAKAEKGGLPYGQKAGRTVQDLRRAGIRPPKTQAGIQKASQKLPKPTPAGPGPDLNAKGGVVMGNVQGTAMGGKAGGLPQRPGIKKDSGSWTPDEAATLLYQVGATKEEAQALSTVMLSESAGGNPRAANPNSGARGLWQVMTSRDGQEWGWEDLLAKNGGKIKNGRGEQAAFDPVVNARTALDIYRDAGDLSPWETRNYSAPGKINPKAKQGVLAAGPTGGGLVVPQVKNPDKRPFKGTIPVHGNFDITKGMSQAKWDTDDDAHGATVINRAVNPIVKKWATKYHITVGEGFAPPPSDHRSPEHLVTGTATDVYPTNNDWGNKKGMARFNKSLKVLTDAGVTVLYDGQFGTTPYPNHGEGNHAHVIWLTAEGGGGEALQKLAGLTNQQIANMSASVRAGGGGGSSSASPVSGSGAVGGGGGGGAAGGGTGQKAGAGFGMAGGGLTLEQADKLSIARNLPSATTAKTRSILGQLPEIPTVPVPKKRKRLKVGL